MSGNNWFGFRKY